MYEVLETVFLNKWVKGRFLQKEGMILGKQLLSSTKHILHLFMKMLISIVCV